MHVRGSPPEVLAWVLALDAWLVEESRHRDVQLPANLFLALPDLPQGSLVEPVFQVALSTCVALDQPSTVLRSLLSLLRDHWAGLVDPESFLARLHGLCRHCPGAQVPMRVVLSITTPLLLRLVTRLLERNRYSSVLAQPDQRYGLGDVVIVDDPGLRLLSVQAGATVLILDGHPEQALDGRHVAVACQPSQLLYTLRKFLHPEDQHGLQRGDLVRQAAHLEQEFKVMYHFAQQQLLQADQTTLKDLTTRRDQARFALERARALLKRLRAAGAQVVPPAIPGDLATLTRLIAELRA